MSTPTRVSASDRSLAALHDKLTGKPWNCEPTLPFVSAVALNSKQAVVASAHALAVPYGESPVMVHSYSTHFQRRDTWRAVDLLLPASDAYTGDARTEEARHRWDTFDVRWYFQPYVANGPEHGQLNVCGLVVTHRSDQVVLVTYGCDHDYVTTTVSNCYHRTRCTRCDHEYFVDSGD